MECYEDLIKKKAKELGYELVGFVRAEILEVEKKLLAEWISRGFDAQMKWISNTLDKRTNPFLVFPEVKSIVVLGINYYQSYKIELTDNVGKISRYAWGKDYHSVLKKKNKELENYLSQRIENFKSLSYVDSGPTMDKVWAVKAGLGWLGKNLNVINTEIGSWFFISLIFTNIELENSITISDHCGTCRACIEACPTQAIVEPYLLDSNKCISYITIEHREDIPEFFTGKMDNWIFGCDICQEVCPWNRKAIETKEQEFTSNIIQGLNLSKKDFINEEKFIKLFGEKAVKRTKYKGLIRNIEFINQKERRKNE